MFFEYPKMLYKENGPLEVDGNYWQTKTVQSKLEEKEAKKDGWKVRPMLGEIEPLTKSEFVDAISEKDEYIKRLEEQLKEKAQEEKPEVIEEVVEPQAPVEEIMKEQDINEADLFEEAEAEETDNPAPKRGRPKKG